MKIKSKQKYSKSLMKIDSERILSYYYKFNNVIGS